MFFSRFWCSNNKLTVRFFKRQYVKRSIEYKMSEARTNKFKSTSLSSATLHVLGSGALGAPKSVYLFTDQSRYLFNCGEGTQRLAHEHKLKLARLEHVFLTSLKWDTFGGLPGVCLTLQDIGIQNLALHGPPGVDELFVSTQKFVVLNKIKINALDCKANTVFEDSTMTVKYVEIHSRSKDCINMMTDSETDANNYLKSNVIDADDTDYYGHELINKDHLKSAAMSDLLMAPRREKNFCMSYICRLKPRRGTLDLQKCVNKGIKPGPLLGLLKNGQDVTLPDGTIVHSNDVRSPDDPGPFFIVIDVPDETYLDGLLECDDFKIHQNILDDESENIPSVIIHFTPADILKSSKYLNFMNSFSSKTQHFLINDDNKCVGSMAVQRVQYQLNLLNNDIFPIINKNQMDSKQTNDDVDQVLYNNLKNNLVNCKTLTSYRLRPENGIDRTSDVTLNITEYVEEPFKTEGFDESLKNFHNIVNDIKKESSNEEYPKIVFFGTGSCIPNKTRNTSGIMLHINEKHSMLLDCGEGTLGQMARFYGKSDLDNIIYNMKAVYISHLHADHHIGLINVIQFRKEALKRLQQSEASRGKTIEMRPLYLIAPKQIMSWLCLYDKRFERILQNFNIIPCSQFLKLDDLQSLESFYNNLNISKLETCNVRHCPNAFGVAITTNESKKITYSGDTMPCLSLINLGQDSDILIHEATMEDELTDEAQRKFHSTTQQAIEVGHKMSAKFTLLTHFSQRYARLPRLNTENARHYKNVGIAFDNMEIAYNNLNILPQMFDTLKFLFAEHCEVLETKAAKRALKRERAQSPLGPSIIPSRKLLNSLKDISDKTK